VADAKEYLEIDLSHTGIEMIDEKLKKIDNPNASAIPIDFLFG